MKCDLHGCELIEAKDEILLKLEEGQIKGDTVLEIVHGYHRGTVLRDYVRSQEFIDETILAGFILKIKDFSDPGRSFFHVILKPSTSKKLIVKTNFFLKNLICGGCNSKFGTELDENLRKRYESIIFWINFKKDKFNKNLDVILDEKDYIFPSKKGPKLKHPIFKNINGKNIPVSFPTMKDGIKYYKNQNINVKEGINSLKPNVKEGIFLFKKTAEKENEFTWRACGKIVYEFLYLIKTNYQPSNTKFINFILGKLNPDEFPLNIAILNDYKPIEKDMDKIYHSIIH